MSSAPSDILLVEGFVEGDGFREPLDGVGDALLESSAPQLRLLPGRLGLGARHRRRSATEGEGGRRRGESVELRGGERARSESFE